MSYIIVKNAGPSWEHYFLEDPKLDAVHPSYSCHESFTAMTLEIKPKYEDFEEAKEDCKKLNKANPIGDYDICVMMSNGS